MTDPSSFAPDPSCCARPKVAEPSDRRSDVTIRCNVCGSPRLDYRVAKAYCASCGALVANCCGD